MNNHNSIWKNITMIIFFIFIAIIVLILTFRFKIDFFLKLNGTKSLIKVKFLFWNLEIKGRFFYKDENALKANFIKRNGKLKIYDKVKKLFISKIKNKIMNKTKNKNNISFWYVFLRNLNIERLSIYEEVGLIMPSLTALAIPIISTVSLFPFRILNLNFHNFQYKILPFYSELRFNLILDSKVSFRIIDIIFGIIKEKMHKLFL